jgi:hypothetical protein
VIRTVHNKIYARRYLTKLTDDKFIAIKIILVRYVFFKIDIAEQAAARTKYRSVKGS